MISGFRFAHDKQLALRRLLNGSHGLLLCLEPAEIAGPLLWACHKYLASKQALITAFCGDMDRAELPLSVKKIMRYKDPDVITVGHITDASIANISIQGGLCSFLMLASLNVDGPDVVPYALARLGIDRFLIEACVIGTFSRDRVDILTSRI